MVEREFYISSADGISSLRCMEWRPEGEVRAVLQIAHGMTEHIGRYREFGAWLAERGIAVYGHDHLGHGKTAADPDDFGYFGGEKGDVYTIKDIRRLTAYGRKQYPGAKRFLLGHSMGSFMVRRYLTVYDDGPDGVVLMGSGEPPAALLAAGSLLAYYREKRNHKRYRSKLLYELSLGSYNRKFRPVKTPYDWLSRDEEKVREFAQDPLCQYIFTARAYRDFFRLMRIAMKLEKAGKVRTDMPLLILSGSKDPVGGNAKGVRKVYDVYHDAGVSDMTIGFYQEARHEILNEQNRQEVYGDILSWMEERICQQARSVDVENGNGC